MVLVPNIGKLLENENYKILIEKCSLIKIYRIFDVSGDVGPCTWFYTQ